MASTSLVFLCGCIALLLAVQGSSAILCYMCLDGVDCEDTFNEDASSVRVIECAGSCSKSKYKDDVTRRCIYGVRKDLCDEQGSSHVCLCTRDLCNGSSNVVASAVVMATMTLVARFISRM